MSDITPDAPAASEPEVAQPVDLAAYQALRAQEEAGEAEDERLSVDIREKTFHVTTELPAIIILDLGVASDPASSTGNKLMALRNFLNAAIVDDEVDAFNHLLRTAKPPILMEELNGITEQLMAKVVAVPTE